MIHYLELAIGRVVYEDISTYWSKLYRDRQRLNYILVENRFGKIMTQSHRCTTNDRDFPDTIPTDSVNPSKCWIKYEYIKQTSISSWKSFIQCQMLKLAPDIVT